MFVLPLILAAAAATSSPSDLFIQRVADMGFSQQRKVVTQGALPPGWTPPAPLPQGVPILGTVSTPKEETQIYYAPPDASAAAAQYESQLRADGYRQQLGIAGQSGFSAATFMSNLTVMCKGERGVSILVPAHDDLRVSFGSAIALGPCARRQQNFTSPVPNLVAPPGVQMIGGGGGGSASYAQGMSNMFSSATLKTSLPAKELMAAFASQMEAAHWRTLPAFVSPQGAAQHFTYDRGTQHWTGTILIFRAAGTHDYDARLDADGTPQFGTSATISPALPAPKLTASQLPAALELVRRIAGTYGSTAGRAQLYIGKTPPSFDKRLPLPVGTLIGSVSSNNQVALFYDLTRQQFDAYLAKLRTANWGPVPQLAFTSGFAAPQIDTISAFCKSGLPTLSTQVDPNGNDVRIVFATNTAPSCTQQFSPFPMQSVPVPLLRAPDGVKIQTGSPGLPGGRSGASFTTTMPLSTLLSNFATQFTSNNWTSTGAPVLSDALGSQSFNYTDNNGKKWQAVLTIYRSSADPKTYYAFIDATQL